MMTVATLGRSVFDQPFRFHATRLLADSVDDGIISDEPAPARTQNKNAP